MPEGERRNSECYNKNIRCLEGDNRLKESQDGIILQVIGMEI